MSSSPHEDEPQYGRRLDPSDDGQLYDDSPAGHRPGPGDQPQPSAPGQGPGDQQEPAHQNPYPSGPYAQGPYAQDPYAQDPYAQGSYGQSPYNPQGYGQQGGGPQDPYGAAAGGQSPYGSGTPAGPQDAGAPPQAPGLGAPYGGPAGSLYGGSPGGVQSGWSAQSTQGAGPSEAPKRPWTLLTSLFLVIGAGLMLAIAGIVTMRSVQQSTPEELMGDPESFTGAFWEGFLSEAPPQERQELLTVFGVMALIFAVIGFFIYLTLAFVGSFAGNPGRIIATIVLGLGLVGNLLSLFPYGAWMLLVAALSLAAIILYWLPPTNAYIRRRREIRQDGAGSYTAPAGPGYGPTPYG